MTPIPISMGPISMAIHDATPEEYAAVPVNEPLNARGLPHPWKWYRLGSLALTIFRPRPE